MPLTPHGAHSRPAENYHQDYYSKKNRYQVCSHQGIVWRFLLLLPPSIASSPTHSPRPPPPPVCDTQFYRSVSGRDTFLERTWGTQFVRTEQAAALKSAAALAARRAGKSESG